MVKQILCLVVGHRWRDKHEPGDLVVLQCRRCGKVTDKPDRPPFSQPGFEPPVPP